MTEPGNLLIAVRPSNYSILFCAYSQTLTTWNL